MSEIVLMADPRVAGVPVDDRGERLVDVRPALLVDPRRADGEGAYAHVRENLLRRLRAAESQLPAGTKLLVIECYRPPDVQVKIFEAYSTELRLMHPDWSPAELRTAASRYVSPPEIGPHCAGAAVDLTLVGPDGRELDMGCPENANPEQSNGACYFDAAGIAPHARRNRLVLRDAMMAAGFVNYPTEWWHWSYGDRYWALMTGATHAHYGTVPGQGSLYKHPGKASRPAD